MTDSNSRGSSANSPNRSDVPAPRFGSGLDDEHERRRAEEPSLPSMPSLDTETSSYLQRLIGRMPRTSPKTRLARMLEEWEGPLEPAACSDIELEKMLWVLTELHLRESPSSSSRRTARTASNGEEGLAPTRTTSLTLDVGSSPAELIHLASTRPLSRITHLDVSSGQDLPSRPANIAALHRLAAMDPLTFPVSSSSFDYIRATSLTSTFRAQDIKAVLQECYRVLSNHGLVEVTFIDPNPINLTPGGSVSRWVDGTLKLGLESSFRCTRPAVLLPRWLREVGFELLEDGGERVMKVALDEADGRNPEVEDCLEVEICRALLKGEFQGLWSEGGCGTDAKWPWEDGECRAECARDGTAFKRVSLLAVKRSTREE